MRIYLVGGAVRDRILGRPVQDRDYVVVGGSEAKLVRRIPGLTKIGRREPVWVRQGEEYTLSSQADILADLALRDLTINALAMDEGGAVIALPGALEDLMTRVLRPVAAANIFADPVRLVRAARFAAQFPDFRVDASWQEIAQAMPEATLGAVAAERVGAEIRKVCAAFAPGRFLRLAVAWGGFKPWCAVWCDAARIPAGPKPYHQESLLEHTAQVMDACAGDPLAVWMALTHDIGKTTTSVDLWPRHHGHERRGEDLARSWGLMLRLSSAWIQAGALAARWHMGCARYPELKASTRVRLVTEISRHQLLSQLARVVQADNGLDMQPWMEEDLRRIKAVRLPGHLQGLGKKSGEVLHALRCAVLAPISQENHSSDRH